ncbi:uncharacterized protein VTP21DRAFT_3949 [Calcarisporiella thermophila]|uniref:uncharacterized protein n=1 Tax=Calcarisporiella thermophila TaxID=911321 RepID=UPI00374249B6
MKPEPLWILEEADFPREASGLPEQQAQSAPPSCAQTFFLGHWANAPRDWLLIELFTCKACNPVGSMTGNHKSSYISRPWPDSPLPFPPLRLKILPILLHFRIPSLRSSPRPMPHAIAPPPMPTMTGSMESEPPLCKRCWSRHSPNEPCYW